MSNKIVDFPKNKTPNNPVLENDKTCQNCQNFSGKSRSMERCMVFPHTEMCWITINACTPDNRRYWVKRKGLITKFLDWLC